MERSNLTHTVYLAYIKLAWGGVIDYTVDVALADVEGENPATFDIDWLYSDTVSQICEARGITRRRLAELAIPKPTRIQNLNYCSELRKRFDLSGIAGFVNGVLELPRNAGFLVFERNGKLITGFRFVHLSQMLKPKVRAASVRS